MRLPFAWRSRQRRGQDFRNRRGLSDPAGPISASDKEAKAASSASRAAADKGLGARGAGVSSPFTRVRVRTTISVASSPMDRAASSSCGVARRKRACHTGESTRNTSFAPFTLASRACAASEGGKQGRRRWSSASSHRARRIGSADVLFNTTSSALRGPGGLFPPPDPALDEWEPDIA